MNIGWSNLNMDPCEHGEDNMTLYDNLLYSWTVEDTVGYVNLENESALHVPEDPGQLDHLMDALQRPAAVIRSDLSRDVTRFATHLRNVVGPVMAGESTAEEALLALRQTCGHEPGAVLLDVESVREPIFSVPLSNLGDCCLDYDGTFTELGLFIARQVATDHDIREILAMLTAHHRPSILPLFQSYSTHVWAQGYLGDGPDDYEYGSVFTVRLKGDVSVSRLRSALDTARFQPENISVST